MKKEIDIIFLIIFFISLFLPIININKGTITYSENRHLSEYIPLYDKEHNTVNFNYGNDFENYIKDRFFGRKVLINLDKFVNYHLSVLWSKFGDKFIDKKKKFMYEHLIADKPNMTAQRYITAGLNKFREFCEEHDIKFYTLIMPRKEMIYIPDLVVHDKNDGARESINEAGKNSNTKLIFTLDEMLKVKDKHPYLLYHKTDHHATIDGTYIGYKLLMNELKKDFPHITVAKLSEYEIYNNNKVCTEGNDRFISGCTCQQIGVPDNICKDFLDVDFRYVKHKDNVLKKEYRDDNIIRLDYFNPSARDLKVMIFGDSFAPNFMEFLPQSFRNIRFIRLNGPKGIKKEEQFKILKYYKNEIYKYNPDIVMFLIFYSDFAKLRSIADIE